MQAEITLKSTSRMFFATDVEQSWILQAREANGRNYSIWSGIMNDALPCPPSYPMSVESTRRWRDLTLDTLLSIRNSKEVFDKLNQFSSNVVLRGAVTHFSH